ncbi:MAG: hypothetical protein H0V31_00345 [Acidobacteria bacterium]|nr:hypothetical protein [Acidobacteriota bacterium]
MVFEIDDVDELFPNESEISIYRVIQESLNNIIKHAEATEARVSIEKTERFVIIKIEDDGKGFEVHDTDGNGFGLIGMTERVRMLGGTLSIESASLKGTKIIIKLELK